MSVKLKLKKVRLSFPYIFDKSDKSNKFEATFMVDPSDKLNRSAIKKAVIDAIGESKLSKAFDTGKIRWKGSCYKSQDSDLVDIREKGGIIGETEGAYRDEYEDVLLVKASNKVRPTVVHKDKSKLDAEDGVVYSGCYVNAVLSIWIQNSDEYGNRINCELQGLQFSADGESFGGGGTTASDDDFDDDFEDEDDL